MSNRICKTIVLVLCCFVSVGTGLIRQQAQQASPPLRVSDDRFVDLAIKRVDPDYPSLIKLAGVAGRVTIELLVDERGNAVSARIISGPSLLRQPAVLAAEKWKFQPASANGVPVKMVGRLSFDFGLAPSNENDIRTYEDEAKANPKSAEAQIKLARVYSTQNRDEDAVAAYKRVISIDSDSVVARFELAELYQRDRFYEEAVGMFRQVLNLKPDFAEAYAGLAWSLERLHRDSDALKVWQEVLRNGPSLDDAHRAYLNVAGIMERSGRIPEAIDAYKHLMAIEKELEPSDPDNWISTDANLQTIASLHEQAGQLEQAIQARREAIALRPNSPYAPGQYCEIGRLYEQMGKSEEALESYRRAVALHSGYAKPHFVLGSLYVKLGSKGLALNEYESLKNLDAKMAGELLRLIREKWPGQ